MSGQTCTRGHSEDAGVDEGFALLVVGLILGLDVALALGMLLGSDCPGGIDFADAHLTRQAGTGGLGLILYEGGLQTSWRRLREVAVPAGLLSTLDVVVSMLLTGVVARGL